MAKKEINWHARLNKIYNIPEYQEKWELTKVGRASLSFEVVEGKGKGNKIMNYNKKEFLRYIEAKKDTGRPTIQLKDLPKNWKKKAFELAKVGASGIEIRVKACGGICHRTWERLIVESDDFCEAIRECADLCRIWWEENGRENLKTKVFRDNLWFINMKNRFHWSDRVEKTIKNPDGKTFKLQSVNSLSKEEADEQLKNIIS